MVEKAQCTVVVSQLVVVDVAAGWRPVSTKVNIFSVRAKVFSCFWAAVFKVLSLFTPIFTILS